MAEIPALSAQNIHVLARRSIYAPQTIAIGANVSDT